MDLPDIKDIAGIARQRAIQIGLFPRMLAVRVKDLPGPGLDPAGVIPNQWAETVERFYGHFSAAAQSVGAQYLIVDGSYLNWRDENAVVALLIHIRQEYKNKVLVSALPSEIKGLPQDILTQFDGLYVILSCPLPPAGDMSGDLPSVLGNLLDKSIHPTASASKLPVILGIDFPAVEAAGSICYQTSREWMRSLGGLPDFNGQPAALPVQTEIYNQILSAAATRSWIEGVVSRGFTMDAARTDASPSVNGKPAADILWYWFKKLQ